MIFKHYLPKSIRKRDGKYWKRSSLLRNVLIVKHCTPWKVMYSNYQIIKILENCFQNMNYYMKSLIMSVKPSSNQRTLLFNAILNMFFIGFAIFSYLIWPHATIIGNTKPYTKLMKFIIKLYENHNRLLLKHVFY